MKITKTSVAGPLLAFALVSGALVGNAFAADAMTSDDNMTLMP